MMPWLWRALGVASVGVGMIGVVVPLLPTTPFLLLAAWAFARSSERLHRWLLHHPRLGPPIADWRERGAVGAGLKLLTVASLLASVGVALAVAAPPLVLILQGVAVVAVGGFVLGRPTAARRPQPGRRRAGHA
jgi:uncharacterized protein